MIRKGFILLGAMSLVLFTSCKDDATKKVKSENVAQAAQRDAVAKNFGAMTFDKTEHDFGTIKEGDQVETTFKFTNTGTSPLLITGIKGSCGCTVPNDWPKEPIAPGAQGEFTVKYNSTNKPNLKTNTVTVTANTEKGREIVRIKAFATPDPVLEAKREKAKVEREARMKAQQEAQKAAGKTTTTGSTQTGHEGHNH
ncbi:DUF1573 domain-containing protein [Kordia sp. YSTF-M3]|uniref:DUF1573 domain-containing protein n=1 Tax=Kordia aestuariivivens TaxID=2759037 RepID=A0ABR7QFQ5_9FLAO|nr:DUF1573 domain-containing protein [Kordia aestuariivivens]MBC8757333.1 DUF1573 domain-containing protein [Kordia aestuariivivens]